MRWWYSELLAERGCVNAHFTSFILTHSISISAHFLGSTQEQTPFSVATSSFYKPMQQTNSNFFESSINLGISVNRKNAGVLQRFLSHSWKAWNHILCPAVGSHNASTEDYCIASKPARHCIIYCIIMY